MKGLIIKKKWIDKIFDEGKRLEMRSSKTNIRGKVKLIQSGTGTIVGEAKIVDCKKLSKEDAKKSIHLHKVEDLSLLEKWCYAWVLEDVKKYDSPIPYVHPKGAVIWVNLTE